MINNTEKLLYPRLEVAQLLSVSLRTVDTLIAKRLLKTVRIGHRNMISRREIERFARAGAKVVNGGLQKGEARNE